MVEARWFDVLSDLGRITRDNKEPFGGMQAGFSMALLTRFKVEH